MSGRRFFTPQAGRTDRTKQVDDEPWGTTSSQSHYKAYESSEARSARSGPAHVKTCLQTTSAREGKTDLKIWERHREDYRDPTASSRASAVTVSETSSAGGSRYGQKYIPAADLVAMRPIPERPFGGVSHYTEHQAEAQQARHDYFPYRDEFHPRSKRLLYEMALNKATKDSDRGSMVSDDSQSCFTIASTAVSKKSASSVASGLSRASSMPGLKPGPSSRLPTGDSLRIGGGTIGSLAKRRKEAAFRAPAQWEPDRRWVAEKIEQDGPAGISSSNLASGMYAQTLDKYGQNLCTMSALLDGSREHPVRERTNK